MPFTAFVSQVNGSIEINEEICEYRAIEGPAEKNLMAAFHKEIDQEIEGFLARVWRDQERTGHADLEAPELALRSSMHRIGGVLLEKLLNSDEAGGQGHAAEFVEYRRKEIPILLCRVVTVRSVPAE
jgi:hypothetical protein